MCAKLAIMVAPSYWIFLIGLFLKMSTPLFGAVEGRHHHYFALEGAYVLLGRTHSDDRPLAVTTDQKTVLCSDSLVDKMSFESGFSAALKIFYDIHSTWECRYMGRFHWKGEKTVSSRGALSLPNNFGVGSVDYVDADQVRGIYRSDMYTGEVNYWRHFTPRYTDYFSASWLLGLRAFNIEEKLDLFFAKEMQASRYRVKTKSRSLGLHGGLSLEYNPYRVLTWGAVLKLGALFNRGNQRTLELDDNDTVTLLSGKLSRSNFAYCAQIYPYIEWHPAKGFTIITYYQVLYIDGISTAENQFFFQPSSGLQLRTSGAILYHGLTVAMQFNF